MQPPQRVLGGMAVIVLDEARVDARLRELPLMVILEEEPARVAENTRLDDHNFRQARRFEIPSLHSG